MTIVLALLLSVLGGIASAVLLQHHLAMEVGGDPLFGRICTASPALSCDQVIASSWGTFAGLPTALWGYIFFSFCTAWFLVVGRATGRQRWMHSLLCMVMGLAAMACVYLAYTMYVLMGKICLLCSITHAVTWLLFLLVILMRSRAQPRYGQGPVLPQQLIQPQEAAEPLLMPTHPSWRLVLVAMLLGTVISAVGWSEYGRRRERAYAAEYHRRLQTYESSLADLYGRFIAQPAHNFVVSPDDPVRGDPAAPHTIIVFSDFQCPWCKGAAEVLDERVSQFPGRFRMIFRHFPMDQVCNTSISKTLHRGACAAAVVAEAARMIAGQDAFWKMHDALFADQAGFRRSAEQWTKAKAAETGLDVEELWAKSTSSRTTWDRIRANIDEGQQLGLAGTPAVFLDGRKFDRYLDEQFWRYLVWIDDQPKQPLGFRTDTALGRTALTTTQASTAAATQTAPDDEESTDTKEAG